MKRAGGMVLVQDPELAEADLMPRAVLRSTSPDLVLPLDSVANALAALCGVIGTRELFFGLEQRAAALGA